MNQIIQTDNLEGIRFEGRLTPDRAFRKARPGLFNYAPRIQTGGTSDDLEPFQSWVISSAGLDVRNYRAISLNRRLPACLRALKSRDCSEALAVLRKHPERLSLAIDSLLLGVTEFFRDEGIFSQIDGQILPEILGSKQSLRVWSAGCSNGAELASVAILLSEAGVLPNCELIGTDCRGSAIQEAKTGLYESASVRKVPPQLRTRYFRPEKNRHRFLLPANAHISWRISDVFRDVPEGSWDLVLCRNLAIYLNPGAAANLWRTLAAAMPEGAYLVTGKAERPASPFTQVSRGIYRKTGAA